MKRILLSIAALSLMVGASAASKRLTTVIEKGYGSDYSTSFNYDDSGRLVKIVDGDYIYTFDYSAVASKKLVLKYESKEDGVVTYDMALNDEGYVAKIVVYDNGVLEDDYYTFAYTAGRLSSYKQISPEEVEESKISYDANGVVLKVENIDGNSASENDITTFEYDGIVNTGNLIMWDGMFAVDLDDMEFAAMAGYMGKAPAQLPVKSIYRDSYGSETETFTWTMDADGYPTGLTMKEESYTNTDIYEFVWENANSGVASTGVDVNGVSRYYTVDGHEVDSSAKGLVIERKADGSTVKRIIK